MKLGDALKVLVVLILLFIVVMVIYSSIDEKYHMAFTILLALCGVVITVFLIAKYVPFKKFVGKPRHHFDFIKEEIRQNIEGTMRIPGDIDEFGMLHDQPDWDVSMNIGDFHYLRFKDNDPKKGRITRNILYDDSNKIIRGEIRGDIISVKPSDAVKEMTAIIEQIKLGQAPRVLSPSLYPQVIREIEERIRTSPTEEQKKEESKK